MKALIAGLFRSLSAPFAWHAVRRQSVWLYLENTISGKRKAIWLGGVYSPLDRDWLRDGDIVCGPRGTYRVGAESELWCG